MPSPKTSKSAEPSARVMLVEGKDDCHVLRKLLELHRDTIPHLSVDVPEPPSGDSGDEDEGGVSRLFRRIGVQMKRREVTRLGVVLDADPQKKQGYWSRIRAEIAHLSDDPLPGAVNPGGVVVPVRLREGQAKGQEAVRFGVWMMPDNLQDGMLEDFLAQMIPAADRVLLPVDRFLDRLQDEQPPIDSLFGRLHRAKARMHCWLAVQKQPGITLGQAVAAYLDEQAPLARSFIDWARRLYVAAEDFPSSPS